MKSSDVHVCYLMLAHEYPELCSRLAQHILDSGGSLVIHLDRKAAHGFEDDMRSWMGADFERIYWARRERVQWGEWSIVQATLNALQEVEDHAIEPDYVYLLSGSDYPIRPLSQLAEFLRRRPGVEYIDLHDAEAARWVIGGPQVERYRYRHWFNWRKHTRLFDLSLKLQQKLSLKREMPGGLHPYIGAQWWVLTWVTCKTVLERARDPALVKFFRTTWIPDELFFQTMVGNLIEEKGRLDRRHLTHYTFSDYGRPVVFCDGHANYLARQPFFFARKISAHADKLRDQLDETIASGLQAPPEPEEVGRDSGDFRRFLERQNRASKDRWTWGRPGFPPLGVLEYNRIRYLVICAGSVSLLKEAQAALCKREGLQCHGQIFGEEQLEFADGVDEVAGYRQEYMAIRDQDRPAFLYDILHAEAGEVVAYLSLEAAPQIPAVMDDDAAKVQPPVHWFDPRATVIRLSGLGMSAPDRPCSTECRVIDIKIGSREAHERLFDIVNAMIAEVTTGTIGGEFKSTGRGSVDESQG